MTTSSMITTHFKTLRIFWFLSLLDGKNAHSNGTSFAKSCLQQWPTLSHVLQAQDSRANPKALAAFPGHGHYVLSELYPGQESKFDTALQQQLRENCGAL